MGVRHDNIRRLINVNLDFDAGETFYIVPWSDWHVEAIDADEDALFRHAEIIGRTKNCYTFIAGDMVDAIGHRDPRFRRTPIKEWFVDATIHEGEEPGAVLADFIAEEVLIKAGIRREKLLAVGIGNHEDSWLKYHHVDIGQLVADRMSVLDRYGGYAFDLKIGFTYRNASSKTGTSCSFVFDVHHGWQSGRRSGGLANQLELELGFSNADAAVRGHVHKKHVFPFDCRWIGNKMDRDWPRLGVVSGTYKLGWREQSPSSHAPSTYELRKGFRPAIKSNLGPPVVVLRPQVGTRGSQPKIEVGWLDSVDTLAQLTDN